MEGHLPYRGRSPKSRVGRTEKSAEVIVLWRYEPMNEAEVSQPKEGLNVFWFLIHNGMLFISIALGKRNRLKSKRMIERVLRSEEHTSELQSRPHLVCRLLLEKKKTETK